MSKNLVAYFSATGTTKAVAQKLAQAAGADIYEIKPAQPYTREDLNWMNKKSRSTLEMQDKSSRPALADTAADIEAYDVIFLGFPIWWYTAPTIINSFLDSYDFSGKKIVLFATSGGSGFEHALQDLKPSVSASAVMVEGRMLNRRISADVLKAFVDTAI